MLSLGANAQYTLVSKQEMAAELLVESSRKRAKKACAVDATEMRQKRAYKQRLHLNHIT